MNVTEQTKAIAGKALQYLNEHPERHNQDHWFGIEGVAGEFYEVWPSSLTDDNLCGTVMCVAGTTVFVTRTIDEFREFEGSFPDTAQDLLGLTGHEADWLFHSTNEEAALKALKYISEGDSNMFHTLQWGARS